MFRYVKFNKQLILTIDNSTFEEISKTIDQYIVEYDARGNVKVVKLNLLFHIELLKKNISIPLTVKNILVEHTSANPDATNFHLANFTNGLIGDMIGKFYRLRGQNVTVCYYVNDMGERIRIMSVIKHTLGQRDNLKLYSLYVAEKSRFTSEFINETYTLLPIELKNKYRRDIVEDNIQQILSMLKVHNIVFDRIEYESFYCNLPLLKKYTIEGNVLYYKLNNKKIYLTSSQNFPLYMLGDLKFTIACKLTYDTTYTVCGKDHQLHFTELCSILQLEGTKTNNLQFIYIPSIKLAGKKMSKSSNNVLKLKELTKTNLLVKFTKYYILQKVLDSKQEFADTFLKYHSYIFELDLFILPVKQDINQELIVYSGLEKFIYFRTLFYHGYVNHKAFFNQLKYITTCILNYFEFYEFNGKYNELHNTLYDAYVSMREEVLRMVNFT